MVVGKHNGVSRLLIGALFFLGMCGFIIGMADRVHSMPTECGTTGSPTADHSKFEALQRDFETAPEVTAACLSCHTEAASQVQHTFHWTWAPVESDNECLGKARYLNNL